jgi:hypothetical protein
LSAGPWTLKKAPEKRPKQATEKSNLNYTHTRQTNYLGFTAMVSQTIGMIAALIQEIGAQSSIHVFGRKAFHTLQFFGQEAC